MTNPITLNKKQYRSDVRNWGRKQMREMKRNIKTLTNSQKQQLVKTIHTKKVKGIRTGKRSHIKLLSSIQTKVKSRYGYPERVQFPFVRHGFYFAVGASKGHSYKKNPRKKKDWYGFIFKSEIEKLADIIVKHEADKSVDVSGLINK